MCAATVASGTTMSDLLQWTTFVHLWRRTGNSKRERSAQKLHQTFLMSSFFAPSKDGCAAGCICCPFSPPPKKKPCLCHFRSVTPSGADHWLLGPVFATLSAGSWQHCQLSQSILPTLHFHPEAAESSHETLGTAWKAWKRSEVFCPGACLFFFFNHCLITRDFCDVWSLTDLFTTD